MPDSERKRSREESAAADGAGLPIDTQAGFAMLRLMLPKLRPQQKNSRCAEDTLALIIEQWVIDANAATRDAGGDDFVASYTPILRKQLTPKQRVKARENMRADAVLSAAMSAVSTAAPEEQQLIIEFVRELATPEGRARMVAAYGGQHEAHDDVSAEDDSQEEAEETLGTLVCDDARGARAIARVSVQGAEGVGASHRARSSRWSR